MKTVALPSSSKLQAVLQQAWLERKRMRPDYSLRKFAEFLDVDATALSRIIKGERKPTPETLVKICDRLAMNPSEMAQLESTAGNRGRPTKNKKEIKPATSEPADYQLLDNDTFEAMSNWYYYGILESAYLDDFKADPKWLARRLDISEMEAKIAINTLQRLNMIQIDADGKWHDTYDHVTNIVPNVSDASRRKLQKQLLEKAIIALETVPIEKRDQTSMTFAVDSHTLAAAKERIKQFRRDMNQLMQQSKNRDEVYQLTVSLFPITKSHSQKRRSL